MRIGVISDTHGDSASVSNALIKMEAVGKPDVLIHLGDGGGDVQYYIPLFSRVYLVRGNWDSSLSSLPVEENVILDGIPFLLTHGHTYRVKITRDLLLSRAIETGVQAALFGHTHSPYCRMQRGILLLNPGCCRDGRFAVLKLSGGLIEPVMY